MASVSELIKSLELVQVRLFGCVHFQLLEWQRSASSTVLEWQRSASSTNMFYSLITAYLTRSLVLEDIRGNCIPINITWITLVYQPKVPNIRLVLVNVKFYKALWKIAIFVCDCVSSHKLSSTTCFCCCTFKHNYFLKKAFYAPAELQCKQDVMVVLTA